MVMTRLQRTQPVEPNSAPRAKRANPTKATTSQTVPTPVDTDQWAQVKALLTRVESALVVAEHRAEKAERRIETLEEFIRNELFPRINTPPPTGPPPPPSPPSSPPPSIAPGQIPGVGLDLSRVTIPEIKDGNAGTQEPSHTVAPARRQCWLVVTLLGSANTRQQKYSQVPSRHVGILCTVA